MIVVGGPTASGKSDLAAALAAKLGGEVISADSRQVYRRLDAATAKPSAALRALVPHHLIDCVEPTEVYDAARFAREAAAAADAIRARGKVPIVCGGTGLYLRALLEGLSPLPPADAAVRARLTAEADKIGRPALHAKLAAGDPRAAAAIPPGNLQRVIRALEVLEITGRPISESWGLRQPPMARADKILVLDPPAEVLSAAIEARARGFWPALLEELRALVPSEFRGDEPGFTAVGYREGLRVLRGELTSAAGLADVLAATRAYARRQRTWFRHQLIGAIRIEPGHDPVATLARARAALEARHEARLP